MSQSKVLSLYDYSGNIVQPWAENGWDCYAVDVKHDEEYTEEVGSGSITYVPADMRRYLPPNADYDMAFAFPPCTHLAVSGARWFKQKGLSSLSEAIELVERGKQILEWTGAPWMLENPVSTLSTYWRSPDYTFHPYEYDGFAERDEAYSKKTCLWTSDDFVMPETEAAETFDDRIHKMAPSDDRAERRSETPLGFARAVYRANAPSDA